SLPDQDRDDDEDAEPERPAPAPRRAQGEQVETVAADEEDDPEPDRVDECPADERRVRVELLIRTASATAASAGDACRVVEQGDDPDEARPQHEADAARRRHWWRSFDLHDGSA